MPCEAQWDGEGLEVRRRVATVLTLAIVLELSYAQPVAAADNAPCQNDGGSVYQFSGEEYQDLDKKHGVSGTIDGQDLHQCTNPDLIEVSGTFAWSALGDGGSDPSIIMQLGIGKCRAPGFDCGSDMRYLWAWGRHSSAPGCAGKSTVVASVKTIGGYDGAAHDYKIYHKNNSWRFYIGLTEVRSIAESEICWTPTKAWWFSETWDNGDALGGSAGNKLRTRLTNYTEAENGSFVFTGLTEPCAFNPGAPRFCDRVDSTTVDTWTSR